MCWDHKDTSVSTRLVDLKPDGFISRAAGIAEEVCRLVEAGFEYVGSTPEKLMILENGK